MNENNSIKPLLSYVFLILALFVGFLFTKDIYSNLQQNLQDKENLNAEITKKQAEYEKLSKIKSDIQVETEEVKKMNFQKFLVDFSDDLFLAYFHTYVRKQPKGRMSINSISLTPGTINDFGFKEGKIDLSMTFLNEESMLQMIQYIIDNEDYNFYIHNFSYPYGNVGTNFEINIPITILYK